MGGEPVTVYHVGEGHCLVWNALGAHTLRHEHRLVGCYVGSPSRNQRKQYCTLPLLLMPEEVSFRTFALPQPKVGKKTLLSHPPPQVSLALQHGWIKLLDDSVPYSEPLQADKAAYESCKRLAATAQEKRREHQLWRGPEQLVVHQPLQKKRRRRSSGHVELSEKALASPDVSPEGMHRHHGVEEREEEKMDEERVEGNQQQRQHVDRRRSGSSSTSNIPVLCAEDVCGQPWRREERVVGLEEWRRNIFPGSNPQATQREAIFAHLWQRPNSYVSSGAKFGGDFLVYPGDPLHHHASHIVTVVEWDKSLAPLDMIAIGRVAVSVKKTAVFASVHENHPVLLSMEWQGV